MSTKDLGFGRVTPKPQHTADVLERAAQLRPTPIVAPDPTPAQLSQMVDTQDTIRQTPALKPLYKTKSSAGPQRTLNMRASIELVNRFVQLSTVLGLSYPKTLERLLDSAGVDPRGNPTRPID